MSHKLFFNELPMHNVQWMNSLAIDSDNIHTPSQDCHYAPIEHPDDTVYSTDIIPAEQKGR